ARAPRAGGPGPRLGPPPPASGPVRLLALGDPTFASPGAEPFPVAGGLPRLEASAREVALVARYAPEAEVRLRAAASAAWLKRADLTPFRVLHLATHAVVDESTAARTALALAPGDGDDGFVAPGELAA